MNREEFLSNLRKGLSCLPKSDIDERVSFYSEMIDDRIEEGVAEEDAVAQIGSVDTVIEQIIADTPLSKLVKEKVMPKRILKTGEIVLLILGSPIWVSLLVALFSVILSFYIALWSVIISLWAVEAALIGSAFGGLLAGLVFAFVGYNFTSIAIIAAAIVCISLFIFMFFGCKAATKGLLALTKKIIISVKNCFIRREEV